MFESQKKIGRENIYIIRVIQKIISGTKKCLLDSFAHFEKIAFASSLLHALHTSISFPQSVNLLTGEGKDKKKKT